MDDKSIETRQENGHLSNNGAHVSVAVPDVTKDEVPERGSWGNQMDFMMACLGYAVGLGNVWRFPYLCYRNGGGAFLIPFFIMMLMVGLPIFFLEMVLGQYSGFGPVKAFARMTPIFQGTGFAVIVVISLITILYMVIVAWILFYIFASFTSELKWGSCGNDFNTLNCFSILEDDKCRALNNGTDVWMYFQQKCTLLSEVCKSQGLEASGTSSCWNGTGTSIVHISKVINRTLAAEEYYYNYVLGRGDSTWENFGLPSWQLTLCLLLAWIMAFLCLLKGINNAGIVIYVTVISPYVLLVALLIRGLTLEGSYEGVMFYITPDFSTLANPKVWGDAASQIFYSFGIGCGSLLTLASYNRFDNNCHTDAIFVSFANVLTAAFAGFVIFSITGFLAHEMGVDVADVAQQGPGLAFVAYPEAVLHMPLPQLWSVLFFCMMLMLGLSSQFAGIEAINASIIDTYPALGAHRWKVTLGTCVVCFLLAIPMLCNGGVYLFTLMDWNTASWAILLIGMLELVQVSWVYGINRFMDNLGEMKITFPRIIRWYWKAVLTVIAPVFCLGVFIYQMAFYEVASLQSYVFPVWADAIGIMIGVSTLAPIPIVAVYRIAKHDWKTGWCGLLTPTVKWKRQKLIETKSRKKSLIMAKAAAAAESDLLSIDNKSD